MKPVMPVTTAPTAAAAPTAFLPSGADGGLLLTLPRDVHAQVLAQLQIPDLLRLELTCKV